MGKVYARKIMDTKDGSFTIANVPGYWLDKVKGAFAEFVRVGEITAAQYEFYVGEPYPTPQD